MNQKINLGKVDNNAFKESRAASIARFELEKNNKIKTHFMDMDKTPNFDGKAMILEGGFERITIEVQIKSLPSNAKKNVANELSFSCDTKAMNCVLKNVTFNPVVLIVVDTKKLNVYYKVLNKEYVASLEIGTKKTKKIVLTEEDIFQEDKFIREIYRQVKITETDVDCITECGKIRDSIKNAEQITKENYQLVYQRGGIKGYFTTYKYICDEGKSSFILSFIKMKQGDITERLHFQYDKDYIHINRVPSEGTDITDADIANIILEVAKEVKKPILYTNYGKPTYWFNHPFLWQLRAEEIKLDWYLRY